MTVTTSTRRVSYSGDGSTTAFPVPFEFFNADELRVIELVTATGVETTKVLTTHYTVSGGGGAVGTVTAVTAPASGRTWTIVGNTDQTQEVDYTPFDPFPADVTENALDRLSMVNQEQQVEINRSLKIAVSDDPSMGVTIPPLAVRAGRSLGFDDDGNITTFAAEAVSYDLVAASGGSPARSLSAWTADIVLTFPTMAFLRASTAVHGLARVLGYYDEGDGGGGLFWWDSASSEAHDGGMIIARGIGGTGRWKRLFDGDRVYARWFGVKADGSTDDTVFLFAAWSYGFQNHCDVIHPAGDIKVTDNYEFIQPNILSGYAMINLIGVPDIVTSPLGVNIGGTVIRPTGAVASPFLKIRGVPPDGTSPVATTYFEGGGIQGIRFDAQDCTTDPFDILDMSGWSNATFERASFINATGTGVTSRVQTGFSTNPDYSASQRCNWRHCYFFNNGQFGFLDTHDLGSVEFSWEDCFFTWNMQGGIVMRSNGEIAQSTIGYNGFNINEDGTYSQHPSSTEIVGLQLGVDETVPVQNFRLYSIEFDRNLGHHLLLTATRGFRSQTVRFLCGPLAGFNNPQPRGDFVQVGFGTDPHLIDAYFDGFYVRLDPVTGGPYARTGIALIDPTQAVGIHVRGYELSDSSAGGITFGVTGGFTGSGVNYTNDYSVVGRDGAWHVEGTNNRPIGSIDVATVASVGAAPVTPSLSTRIKFITNGNAGAACLAVHDGTSWKRVVLGATISTS